MRCPYISVSGSDSCRATGAAYHPSVSELDAYCHTACYAACPFFRGSLVGGIYDPAERRLWPLSLFT